MKEYVHCTVVSGIVADVTRTYGNPIATYKLKLNNLGVVHNKFASLFNIKPDTLLKHQLVPCCHISELIKFFSVCNNFENIISTSHIETESR